MVFFFFFFFQPVVPDENQSRSMTATSMGAGFYDLADEIYVPTEVLMIELCDLMTRQIFLCISETKKGNRRGEERSRHSL